MPERTRGARLRPFAAISAAVALISIAAQAQTSTPDLVMNSYNDLGGPRPNGQISTTFLYTGSATPITVDAVVYRGSLAAGTATEILRKPLSFTQGAFATIDTGPVIPFNEGDIFTACVNPNRTAAESNYNNNCVERVVSTPFTDLSVGVADISMSPVGAAVGQTVNVTARVRNKYNVTARTLVRLFQSHPNAPASKLLGQNTITIPASGSAVATFTVVRPPGDSNFFVQLEDVYPHEITPADNIASRNVYLKAIINTSRTSPGSAINIPYASAPAVGDLLGTGQPVMVFAEYISPGTSNSEARITAIQVFNDGTSKEVWSKAGFLAPAAIASAPAIADIDGDGQPEIIFEAVHYNPDHAGGQMGIFVLNKDGSVKWQHVWDTVGRVPCRSYVDDAKPTIGDMNGDGVADIVVLESDIVVLDGRNGNELVRKPGIKSGNNVLCSNRTYSVIADINGDGKNEYIAGDFGIHVFKNDGTILWENTTYSMDMFALLDVDKDGKPEIVIPVFRSMFVILDAATGVEKQRKIPSPNWTPWSWSMAATTSLDPAGYPSLIVANNDFVNGTALLDKTLTQKWFNPVPPALAGNLDNPSYAVLADLLGQGRPQVISHSGYRNLGIQDSLTGQFLEYFDIAGAFNSYNSWPIPVDVDGDGRGEIIVNYGVRSGGLEYQPSYPTSQFLIFGSDQWKKIPTTWNQTFFVPNQVDQKLNFKHDYQPWKTHNTWMQQPLRKPCDIDFDDDVDQEDINAITSARGQTALPGDWRDYDKDGLITVNDARACTQLCTSGNCAITNPGGRILSVSPRQVFPGSTVNVSIRAEFLKFKAGQVTVNFGSGVTVSNLNVVDPDSLTATVAIAPGQTGDRSITITSGTVTASRPSALSLSAGNLPPVVKTGPNQTLVLPGSINVSGTVTDDGMPYNQLTYGWQFVSGTGQVTFSNPNALTTPVSFSQPGYYVLRLSASDGQYFANGDVGVVVVQGNQAPYVNAGEPMTVQLDAPSITLQGSVQDDGLPFGSQVTSQWTKVSGPGTVAFTAPNSTSTRVAFSAAGAYVLSLAASDGQLTGAATVAVTVNPPTPRILSVGPDTGTPGQTRTITIVTRYTNFSNGTTQANFGAGVSVGGAAAGAFGLVTVIDATTATAQVTISSGAALGARTVTVATGTEQASLDKGFTVGTVGIPYSVQPNLNYLAVPPGGSIAATPQVVDAAGNVISGAAGFSMTVTPKPGLAMGTLPAVNGLSATFPKLQKRLVITDPVLDPTGKYADTDPSDPNYGKETGGIYTVEVTLNGTAVKGSVDLVVLPSGTAEISLASLRASTELIPALDAARLAATSGDLTAISSAVGALAVISHNPDYNPKVLSANNVIAPADGFPVTYSQVAARFPSSPDDLNYGRSLDAIASQLQLLRARIDSISAATLSLSDINALSAGAATYKSMLDQLHALKPSPLGVTVAGNQVDNLLSNELPLLLDSMNRKSAQLLTAVAAAVPTFTPHSVSHEGPGLVSHASTYDILKDFVSQCVSIFSNMAGYAKENIIELASSLANDLINIGINSLVNASSPGGVDIEYVHSGSDFSFACPNFPDTYVEGDGFNPRPKSNFVTLIGCINSAALRDLLSLKRGVDPKSASKLFNDLKKIVQALGLDKFAAEVQPDQMRPGYFGGSQMVFTSGWPQVNQGRLPCVGDVIVFNKETGGYQSVNLNILASCN